MVKEDRVVIDITTDEYIEKLFFEEVHVGREGAIHKIFCCDRVAWDNKIFTNVNRCNVLEAIQRLDGKD